MLVVFRVLRHELRVDAAETKLDQILFNLNNDQFLQFTQTLEAPVSENQGLSRLMAAQAPWGVAASQAVGS